MLTGVKKVKLLQCCNNWIEFELCWIKVKHNKVELVSVVLGSVFELLTIRCAFGAAHMPQRSLYAPALSWCAIDVAGVLWT